MHAQNDPYVRVTVPKCRFFKWWLRMSAMSRARPSTDRTMSARSHAREVVPRAGLAPRPRRTPVAENSRDDSRTGRQAAMDSALSSWVGTQPKKCCRAPSLRRQIRARYWRYWIIISKVYTKLTKDVRLHALPMKRYRRLRPQQPVLACLFPSQRPQAEHLKITTGRISQRCNVLAGCKAPRASNLRVASLL